MRDVEESICIVGGGTMGAGIAWVAALAQYRVQLVEPDAAARERGRSRLEKSAARSGNRAPLERIAWLDAIPQRSDAVVAIEAVPERFELKRDVLLALERAIAPTALLATNTSSLSIGELAESIAHPDRLLGIHFFNPPAAMELVEIVQAESTSEECIDRARAFVERLGKTAVLAADTPGFIVNRIARPFYLQAMRAAQRGVAPIGELDALARSVGFAMGPFELMDFIGLDVNLAVSESIYERTGEARLAPSDLQRELVAQGKLGRKTGAGFYEYQDGAYQIDADTDADPNASADCNEDEIVAIVGFGGVADEMAEMLEQRFAHVQRIESDELLDELRADATMVIDIGDGTADRGAALAQLDSLLGTECVLFTDAYATDLQAAAKRMRHPERLVGYGVIGALSSQAAVEIVEAEGVSDDALALAQELFEMLGKSVVLVADVPGLFLGRTIASIVNEAVTAIHENVATPEDIDIAMRLGTKYPLGPIAWGREVGGARIARILHRLAAEEGDAFAPHRSLWVLDMEQEQEVEPVDAVSSAIPGIL